MAKGKLSWGIAGALALVGCADDDSSATPAGSTGAGPTSMGPTSMDGASESSTGSSGSESSGPANVPYDGEPLAITRDGAWHWFDIEGMACADGRPSGVGVRAVEDSAGLVIYFKGGGACFNASSCGLTAPLMITGPEAIDENPDGVLDFLAADNPLAGYDIVYFPYCTGDVHGGSAPATAIPGREETWDFVGHGNVLAALDRLAPTFPAASRLVVLGTSAGGLGALLSFPSIVLGWPTAETFLLDDSGMIFRDDYLAPCLQQQMRDTWGLAPALPQDCPECTTADGGGLAQYFVYLADHHPDVHFGLIASSRDLIVRIFFGYGNDECQPGGGLPDLGEQRLMEALDDLRAEVLVDRFATYVVDSDVHVWTTSPEFYTVESGGVALRAWFDDFLAGEAASVAP